MANVSHKLSNALEGALAGGGDPATSPLYVFGPFLKLVVAAGVAQITFGASLWLVIVTIALVSAMYRLVMAWIIDGSGGSGLSEEEFGSWAVKVNAGITFVEYTLTFLVSMAALTTFVADRFPVLNEPFLGLEYRTFVAISLSLATGWLVNRGPKVAARTFGPATAGVLLLLWAMVLATIWRQGLHLPTLDWRAFTPEYATFTFGGYARILAVMTGIEIFANLVAAYEGTPREKSRRAFKSLLIVMGTTAVTMLVVGPAILRLSDPLNTEVSVFTQAMDQLLPAPLPLLGTAIGVAVLLSASAASAQGLQNLALGLKLRHYIPAFIGQRNQFDVADKPVWIEVGLVSLCFLVFGTNEETYLAIYAAGVFVLLSMTGWAAAKRLLRSIRKRYSHRVLTTLAGTIVAALLTSGATLIIFGERFTEGAWTYFIMLPVLYLVFGYFRNRLGEPTALEERRGLFLTQRKYLPAFERDGARPETITLDNVMVPLSGSPFAEQALSLAQMLSHTGGSRLTIVSVIPERIRWSLRSFRNRRSSNTDQEIYVTQVAAGLELAGVQARGVVRSGPVAEEISALAHDNEADLLVMSTHGRGGLGEVLIGSITKEVIEMVSMPVLLLRPTDDWRSRGSRFRRLLVTLDGSDPSEQVLPYAQSIATRFKSEITLLSVPDGLDHAVDHQNMADYLETIAARLRQDGLNTRTLVTGQDPSRTIVEVSTAEASDLIMMTANGRRRLDRFLVGSVADQVVKRTPCPVFLVPVRPQKKLD